MFGAHPVNSPNINANRFPISGRLKASPAQEKLRKVRANWQELTNLRDKTSQTLQPVSEYYKTTKATIGSSWEKLLLETLNVFDTFDPATRQAEAKYGEAIKFLEFVNQVVLRIRNPDGSRVWIATDGSPLSQSRMYGLTTLFLEWVNNTIYIGDATEIEFNPYIVRS